MERKCRVWQSNTTTNDRRAWVSGRTSSAVFVAARQTKDKKEARDTLFEANSSSVFSHENRILHKAVDTALQRLVHMLAQLDRNLTGTLIGVGSYFDGTRVCVAPSEFDYIYELTEISSGITKAEPHGPLEYRFQVHSESTFTPVSPWLSNILVRDRLYTLIDQVMKTISLPGCLHHGGILCPCFSGIRKNGPAFTLLFAWSGGNYTQSPLLVSVDITVGIRAQHLQIFSEEQTKVAKISATMEIHDTGAHQLYYIAHPDREDAWQMTTAALEVAIMSKVSKKVTRIIKKLKALKGRCLTLTEEGDTGHMHYSVDHKDISEVTGKVRSMVEAVDAKHSNEMSAAKKRTDDLGKNHVECYAHKFEDDEDEAVDIKRVVQCVMEIQQCWFRQTKTPEASRTTDDTTHQRETLSPTPQHEPIPEEYQDAAKLIHKLCCAYLKNSTKDLAGSNECGSRNLAYLADILPPGLCKAAMEDYKPAITLKSCIFKYVIIGAVLSGELPRCFSDEDKETEQNDLGAVIWVLNQIRQSKQLRHPLLNAPIQTYSLAYRGYVVAPSAEASHIENRLSEMLYHFLDKLIHILDNGETTSRSDST